MGFRLNLWAGRTLARIVGILCYGMREQARAQLRAPGGPQGRGAAIGRLPVASDHTGGRALSGRAPG